MESQIFIKHSHQGGALYVGVNPLPSFYTLLTPLLESACAKVFLFIFKGRDISMCFAHLNVGYFKNMAIYLHRKTITSGQLNKI